MSETRVAMENVVCRVDQNYALECHLDFDEGNAVGVRSHAFGELIKA